MGKKRIIAETGAGQHGTATAVAAAKLGMECDIYMGTVDIERQAPNVQRMKLAGAKVIPVTSGSKTLKDAINECLRNWTASCQTTHYLLGSVLGPHPYPTMVAHFQSIIGKEAKKQILKEEKKLPKAIIACVGGGSNAIGIFKEFIPHKQVELIGVEAGGLVGLNEGTINNCYSTGTVNGVHSESYDVGGIVGTNTGFIFNSHSSANISGGFYGVRGTGGLVGTNYNTINNSYATGAIDGDNRSGGLVGVNDTGTINESYATGNVRGDYYTGGLVGRNDDHESIINNSYSTGGWVSSQYDNVGGLVGVNNGAINNSYSTRKVSGRNEVGGLVGDPEHGTCNNSFWDINTSEQPTSGCEAIGKTTAAMKQQNTFTNWNFSTIWAITENQTYPLLRPPPTPCTNNIKDASETDTDCGGSCEKCQEGESCLLDQDCASNHCNELYNICDVPGDLYIEWIKPIQVVEDVPLVAGKATVVRVKVVNNGPEVKTSVDLDVGSCSTLTEERTFPAYSSTIVDFYPDNECIQ